MKQEEKYQKWKLCEKGYIYTHDYYILFLLTMTKPNDSAEKELVSANDVKVGVGGKEEA